VILSIDAYLCASESCWADAHMVMGSCMRAGVPLRILPFSWLQKGVPDHVGGAAAYLPVDMTEFRAVEVHPPILVVKRVVGGQGFSGLHSTQTLSGDCWPELDKELAAQKSAQSA